MSENRRTATTTATCFTGRLLGALTVAGLVLSGCQHSTADRPTADGNGSAINSTASNSVGVAAPGFTATMHPCNLIDHRAVSQILGPDGGAISPARTDPVTPSRTLMTCTREYGEPGADLTIVALNLILTDPADTRDQYENLRQKRAGQVTATDVPGVGEGAYTFTDPDIGQTLTVFDGNLFADITIHPVTGSVKPASTVIPMMVATAHHVMDQLRAH